MTDDTPLLPPLPQASVTRRRRARLSVVWIIPILAAVVAVGIAVQRILSEGPSITIVFKTAAGLEAGKTFIKYKDVSIGQVTQVRLSPDASRVEVTAKIDKSAAGLMVEDARFWVVEPRITLGGVSGLGTLLSGNYIGFQRGRSTRTRHAFTALDVAPVLTDDQPGRQFVLRADRLGSLGIGAPVYYRSLRAGQVIAYNLTDDGQAVDIKIFVNAPYDQQVHAETRFWNASGIDVSVGANGVDVRLESVAALIGGGVAFDTPVFARSDQPVGPDMVFTLHRDQLTAMKQPESIAQRYLLHFTESLRGLSVGAPVTILGLPAGEVTEVGLDIDPVTSSLRGRVEIVAFPERIVARLDTKGSARGQTIARSPQQRRAFFRRLVEERGLRAQLRSGSLLTGQLYVAFDYHRDAPRATVDWSQDRPALPVVPSVLPDLEAKLGSIAAKLERLPYDQIGAEVSKALTTLTATLQDTRSAVLRVSGDVTPELKATLEDVRRLLATADGVLRSGVTTTVTDVNRTLEDVRRLLATADGLLRTDVAATLTEVNARLDELRRPIATADTVLKDADATLVGKNAPLQQELREALQEVTRAARALRGLMDHLERHPEALIRGKTGEQP